MTKKSRSSSKPKKLHFVGNGFRVHNLILSGFRMDMEFISHFIM